MYMHEKMPMKMVATDGVRAMCLDGKLAITRPSINVNTAMLILFLLLCSQPQHLIFLILLYLHAVKHLVDWLEVKTRSFGDGDGGLLANGLDQSCASMSTTCTQIPVDSSAFSRCLEP